MQVGMVKIDIEWNSQSNRSLKNLGLHSSQVAESATRRHKLATRTRQCATEGLGRMGWDKARRRYMKG